MDPTGRLAFHTGYPNLAYSQSDAFFSFAPIYLALAGTPVQLDEFTNPLSHKSSLGAFMPIPRHRWAVGVTAPRSVALAPFNVWLRAKLAVLVGIMLLSALLAALLARFYAHRVRALQMLARALGRGEMGQRVAIQTGDELEELGAAFNEMASQVAQRQAEVDRLRAQAERHASQLDAIIASVPDAIFLASPDGRLFDANPAGCRLLGLKSRSELDRTAVRPPPALRAPARGWSPLARGRASPEPRLGRRDVHRHGAAAAQPRRDGPAGQRQRSSGPRLLRADRPRRDRRPRHHPSGSRWRRSAPSCSIASWRCRAISQALVREVELERIAHVAIEQSLHALGADAVGLWLAKPDHPELSLISSHGLTPRVREELQPHLLRCAAAHRSRGPVGTLQVVESLQAEGVPSLAQTLAQEEGFRGLVAIPLHSRGTWWR